MSSPSNPLRTLMTAAYGEFHLREQVVADGIDRFVRLNARQQTFVLEQIRRYQELHSRNAVFELVGWAIPAVFDQALWAPYPTDVVVRDRYAGTTYTAKTLGNGATECSCEFGLGKGRSGFPHRYCWHQDAVELASLAQSR